MQFKNELEKQRIKKYAEVFTPTTLVCEMLDLLPNDVWYNPNLKWFDPCNGLGAFTLEIINRLMNTLIVFEPDYTKRYNHIITNMIYVCEIQETSAISFSNLFEIHINQYNGDYLSNDFKYHCSSIWNVEKFDIIIMNPPYQGQSKNKGANGTLWDRFVKTAILNNLKEDGYLVAVHPNSWRGFYSSKKEIHNLLFNLQILYLEFHTLLDGKRIFGVNTPYDFYCLQNTKCTFPTIIKDVDCCVHYIKLNEISYLPNGKFDEFNKLITDNILNQVNLLFSKELSGAKSYISRSTDTLFKYPVVYVTHKDKSINLIYSSVNDRGYFGIPKVFWSNGIASSVQIDYTGKYGLSEFAYGISDDIEIFEKIQYAMNHPKFIELMKYCNGGNQKYSHYVIKHFRKDFWKEFQSEY